jgi:Spy/CpxP family protein refolding chaperone
MKIVHMLLIAGSTILTGAGAFGVWAAHGGGEKLACMHGHGDKKAMMLRHMTRELDLTDEQQAKVSAVIDSIHSILVSKHEQKKACLQEIVKEFENNSITEDKIIQHWQSHSGEMNEIVPVIAKQLVTLNAILTQEQRSKVIEKIQTFHGMSSHSIF